MDMQDKIALRNDLEEYRESFGADTSGLLVDTEIDYLISLIDDDVLKEVLV